MSKRLFYLADGTLRTVTAGRFRGDDEVAGKTLTEQIVVRDDGRAGAHRAPVHIDPDNPEGPLVIHYDSGAGQEGLSIVDDADGEEVFQITNAGVVEAPRGIEASILEATVELETSDLKVTGNVSGSAFDKGAWVPEGSGLPVPTKDTVVTRNATTESVSVANLRVTARTAQPKSYDAGGNLVNDNQGEYAGDGVASGLYFEKGEVNDALRCAPPLNAQDAGGRLFAQSLDDKRIYRFGFDPEKNADHDGLHFTNTDLDRQVRLTLGDEDACGRSPNCS